MGSTPTDPSASDSKPTGLAGRPLRPKEEAPAANGWGPGRAAADRLQGHGRFDPWDASQAGMHANNWRVPIAPTGTMVLTSRPQ